MSEYIIDYELIPLKWRDGYGLSDTELTEEIVRCRDCKFCMAYMAGTYCDYMAHSVEPDGFCAWAERRDA